MIPRRVESTRNAVQLGAARIELDQLLAMKDREADEASSQYSDLQAKYEAAATEAADLGSLLRKVASLRSERPSEQGVIVVCRAKRNKQREFSSAGLCSNRLSADWLTDDGAGVGGVRAPGLTFLHCPGHPGRGARGFGGSFRRSLP